MPAAGPETSEIPILFVLFYIEKGPLVRNAIYITFSRPFGPNILAT